MNIDLMTLLSVFGLPSTVIAFGALLYLKDWIVARRKCKLDADIDAIVSEKHPVYSVETLPNYPRNVDTNKYAAKRRKQFHVVK